MAPVDCSHVTWEKLVTGLAGSHPWDDPLEVPVGLLPFALPFTIEMYLQNKLPSVLSHSQTGSSVHSETTLNKF